MSGWRRQRLEAAGNAAVGVEDETPLYPAPNTMKPENPEPKNPNYPRQRERESESNGGGQWLCR